MGWDIYCEDGWFDILFELVKKLEQLNLDHPSHCIVAKQIKAKYGDLCFYYDVEGDPDSPVYKAQWEAAGNLVAEASVKAVNTCEVCGKEGFLVKINGWYQTLCPECEKKRNYKTKG